ncbi:24173_t:CDS:2 [Dentiscutata erythropus]|uniref:24173_t:CDS:1 n=1 Tax=Dentiscutata erythropus TaxID=1348616 RepID=A0A9N8ZWD9_9GLOM|nr:24173_t:CDS:2 [Dentiscutata erythropus]
MSKVFETIQIESDIPHNGNDDGQQLKHENMMSEYRKILDREVYDKYNNLYKSDYCEYSKLFTVSDNKLVLMRIFEKDDKPNLDDKKLNVQKLKIGIFDFKTRWLYMPNFTIPIDVSHSTFMKNGDIVMINLGVSNAYVLTPKKTGDFLELICKSTISFKRSPDTRVFVTPSEKLLIYDGSRFGSGYITKWDIKTSLFKAQYFLSNVYEVHDIKLNYNESLLLVYTTKYMEKKEPFLSLTVYLANNGMKLVTYMYPETKIIDVFDIIASENGERLLVMSHDKGGRINYELRDPYTYAESIAADKLFEFGSSKFNAPCVVAFNKIVGFVDGNLSIKDLIHKNWIKYLREELKDYNRITIPSGGKIIESMVNDSKIPTSNEFFDLTCGNLVKWTLRCDSEKAILKAKTLDSSDERDIILDRWKNMQFVMQYSCLYNDDLALITDKGVFIWTFKTRIKKIVLIYYYSNKGKNMQEIFKESTFSDSFLPSPHFVVSDQEASYLFEELLETYAKDEFYLIIYGSNLMTKLVQINETKLMENLYKRFFEINFKNKNDPNIQLFSIISQSITKLSRENSIFVTDFMSEISFFITSDKYFLTQILEKGTSTNHLRHIGLYNQLYTSFLDTLIYKIFAQFDLFLQMLSKINFIRATRSFYEEHFVDFKHFSDERKLSKKLYISPILLNAIKGEPKNEIQEIDKLNILQKEMKEIDKLNILQKEMKEMKELLKEIKNKIDH